MVYPVQTLPPEIISEIFVNCLSVPYREPDPNRAPLLLGRICRQWRSIALSTPKLWSRVVRYDVPDVVVPTDSLCELLKIWLARSGSHPLTIHLTYEDWSGHGVVDHSRLNHQYLQDLLLQHAHHWEIVTLAPVHEDLEQFFGDSSQVFPLLKSLDVSCARYEGFEENTTALLPSLDNCPQLREFTVHTTLLSPFPTQIPWAQLTQFVGHSITLEQARQVLQVALHLRICHLDFEERYGDSVLLDSAENDFFFTLPELKSLELTCEGRLAQDLMPLPTLTIPALGELHIGGIDSECLTTFFSFQSRSSCLLTRLHVLLELDEPHLVQFLLAVPHLVELHVQLYVGVLGTNRALCLLTLGGQHQYLPRLKTLSILRNGTEPPLDYQVLVDMLESRERNDNDARLAEFRSSMSWGRSEPQPEDPQLGRLTALKQRGMRISINEPWTVVNVLLDHEM
jgi:hypothetical protein